MQKLCFVFIIVTFLAVGCSRNPQSQPDQKTRSAAIEADCQFSSYSKIDIVGLDASSCKRISQYFIVDKNHVYKQLYDPGSSSYSEYQIVSEADAATFTQLNFGYYKDSLNLFFDAGLSYRIIPGTDIDSLQVLSTHYLKDKNHIYLSSPETSAKLTPISDFDVETFEVIQNEQNHEQYFRDKNGIYFSGEKAALHTTKSKIKSADNASFVSLDYYSMAKDSGHVYFEGKVVNGADPKTFQILGGGYFKDNSSVYTAIGGFRRLQGWDGGSFELINYNNDYEWEGYSKDKFRVYYQDAIVEGADPTTFKVVAGKATDKNYEYKGKFKVNH